MTASDPTAPESPPPALDAAGVMRLIPHRAPFLLVDRVLEVGSDTITGEKQVTLADPWLAGHFPGRPIMPGVLIVEGMAQLGGVFVMLTEPPLGDAGMPSLLSIDDTRFRRPVVPGELLRYELRLDRRRKAGGLALWRFRGRALVAGRLVCESTVSAAFVRSEHGAGRSEEGA